MTTDILVGSYSTHLQILTFDAGAKTLQLTTVPQPSFERYTWISRHPVHQNLFYAGQNPAQGGIGSVTLFKVTGGSGAAHQLEVLQTVPSGGVGPCHLNVKPDGTQLAVANYAGGSVMACKLDASGTMQEEKVYDFTVGSLLPLGPQKDRQDQAHPHGCYFTDAGDILVPDLGCDCIRYLGTDRQIKALAGSGPRHLVVEGSTVYAINELDNTVTVHKADGSEVDPQKLERHSILADDCCKPKGQGMTASEIMLSSDKRHLYLTNREEGHPRGDTIAHFTLSDDGARLTKASEVRAELNHLRGAELFEAGGQGYLITGSRTGKGAVVYLRDAATGALSEVVRNAEVFQPSCFVPLA